MNRTIFTLTLLTLTTAIRGTAEEQWDSFQNGGRCSVDAKNLPLNWNAEQGVAWSSKLNGYGQSAPLVWNNQVYVTSCSGKMKDDLFVRAVQLGSGKTLWERKFSNSTPEKNTSYVSRAAPTPVADQHGVYAFFEGGNLVALDHAGEIRWQRDLSKDYGAVAARHGLAASLEHNRDNLFVWVERSQSPYVLAVSKQDGKTIWKSEGVGKTAWSSPRLVPVGKEHHLVLSASGRIVGLDPASGKHLWRFEGVSNNTTPTPIPLGDGKFLMGASDGRGQQSAGAAKKSNGVIQISKNEQGMFAAKFLWRASKATSSFGSPITAAGNAYFVNRLGVVYCLDAKTGEKRYAERTADSAWATPIHVGNRIYLFGRNGTTTVLRAGDDFQILAKNTLWKSDPPRQNAQQGFGGPVLYAAVISGDRLLLRRGDRLYCVGN